MNERKNKLVIESMLCDISTIFSRLHPQSKEESDQFEDDSLVRLENAAEIIAAAAAQNRNHGSEEKADPDAPLEPVFNKINGKNGHKYYSPRNTSFSDAPAYPTEKQDCFTVSDYQRILDRLADVPERTEWTIEYANQLLQAAEDHLSFVPVQTTSFDKSISIYDHMRMKAAIASCLFDYAEASGYENFVHDVCNNKEKLFGEKAFLLVSMDVSGIQKFIYTITTSDALKTLRARSFYLEILMEHIIDQLLETLELSRANLLYSGGGHCYLLAPDTESVKQVIDKYLNELNEWLLAEYRTDLYIAGAYTECSANDFRNVPDGNYAAMFRRVSSGLSEKKLQRYTSEQIIRINHERADDYTRECKVCRSISHVGSNGLCKTCSAIRDFSKDILYSDFFLIKNNYDKGRDGLPLPGDYVVVSADEKSAAVTSEEGTAKKIYTKNSTYHGKVKASRLYIGNYTTGDTFREFAEKGHGINRIGVLRADVDNLGQTFVTGFQPSTVFRTAVLSRQLSLFFKLYINEILNHPDYTFDGSKKESRNASIVYSGGDDVFIVGAWDDVIELSIDLRNRFSEFTEGALTISGGIGIYQDSYPIHIIAEEVAEMEQRSKEAPGKDSVTVFEDHTYSWEAFQTKVLGEKYQALQQYFDRQEEHGKNFLYNLLRLIRGRKEKINLARYIYLLARMEPDDSDGPSREQYMEFRTKMLQWITDEEDVRQLLTAIELYVYYTRTEEAENEHN